MHYDFVSTLQNAPSQPRYLATLVAFAREPETVILAQPLEKLAIDYKADHMGTAVWDSIAHALMLEKSRHERVVCLIVSDGEDNCSQEADQRQVAAMVATRREWGNWVFVWLNLQGDKPNKNARALGLECLNSTRAEITKILPEVAGRISRAVRLTGGTLPVPIEGGEGGKR